MSNKNRLSMRIAAVAVVILAALGVACGPQASAGNAAPVAVAQAASAAGGVRSVSAAPLAQTSGGIAGGVTVVGMGTAFGAPDQAQVMVGVDTFAPTVSEATSQNEAQLAAVMAALEAAGIAEADIQTTNYSLYAEQRYGDNGPEGIAGYRVTNQVNVRVRDIDQVSDVLAAVTEAGANSIYGVSFMVSDPAALEAEARAAAMADAEARAASLAELGEVSLGDIIVISEVVGSPVTPLGMGGGGYAMEQAAGAPSVSPGQLSFYVQVQVTYAIQ
jgi:uncharacterized protein YggE